MVEITFSHNGGTSEYDGGNGAFVYVNCLADASDTFLSLGFLESCMATTLPLLLECTYQYIAIIYCNHTNLVVNFIMIQDCLYIADGSANQGAGMFVPILPLQSHSQPTIHTLLLNPFVFPTLNSNSSAIMP